MEITNVNYDDDPLARAQIDGIDYRVDGGLGPAVAVSQRAAGTWDWTLVSEGKWDGIRLRARGLDYPVVSVLAQALAEAMRDLDALGSG